MDLRENRGEFVDPLTIARRNRGMTAKGVCGGVKKRSSVKL